MSMSEKSVTHEFSIALIPFITIQTTEKAAKFPACEAKRDFALDPSIRLVSSLTLGLCVEGSGVVNGLG